MATRMKIRDEAAGPGGKAPSGAARWVGAGVSRIESRHLSRPERSRVPRTFLSGAVALIESRATSQRQERA